MNKILVTGSTGLVGSQLVKDLVENEFKVYSCFHNSQPKYGIPIQMDISKQEEIIKVLEEIKPNVIVHLAAFTDVEKCEMQKDKADLLNTKATKFLVKESEKNNVFFVYVSTDYVFDGKKGLRKENDIPNPINHYGKSKLEAEKIIKNSSSNFLIIRTSTPFGIHSDKKNFPLWVKENLEMKNEIHVVIDQFTSPTYVPNLTKMMIDAIKKGITGTINLVGATRISRFEFAKIIAEKFELDSSLIKPIKIQEMKWKAIRPKDSSLDSSKAEKILDKKPKKITHSLDEFQQLLKSI